MPSVVARWVVALLAIAAVAAAEEAAFLVTFDQAKLEYRNGSYDVYLATVANRRVSDAVPVAATPAYEAHASVAADSNGRIWVAWSRSCSSRATGTKVARTRRTARSAAARPSSLRTM